MEPAVKESVLYEDGQIIVCIKPAGVLSQADSGGAPSMVSLLETYTGGTVYPLHRLDREAAGVMVYAKTKEAAARLSRDIADRRLEKEYVALIHGTPDEPCGEWEDLLFRDSRRNKSYVVKRMRKGVRKARLSYEVIRPVGTDTLVSVHLVTGRTHQIRVQFASRGMPLAGDRRYGARDDRSHLALWSKTIAFFHPSTGQRLRFSSGPENPFAAEAREGGSDKNGFGLS